MEGGPGSGACMKRNATETVSSNARRELPRLVESYFEAGREAVRKKRSGRALHRFRIKTKQFRYTLEIFSPIYGPSFKARLEGLQEVQKLLGKISDDETILKLIKRHRKIRKDLDQRHRKHLKQFRGFWSDTFDAPDEMLKWQAYLRRIPAGVEAVGDKPKPSGLSQ